MKIYISSTYRDLLKHRAAVAAALRRMGHQPVGMEEYVAEGAKPLKRCLDDVDASDAYVGIFAWRYGYIPEAVPAGLQLPEGAVAGKTSITECEYRRAVETKKPTLIFLLDADAEWPSSQFDAISGEAEKGAAIIRFRKELSEGLLVSHFRTEQDLASLVGASIYRTEMSRQVSLDSLRIEAKFNGIISKENDLADSALGTIKNAFQSADVLQALQVELGGGDRWWGTRLYFLASLANDLTEIEVIAFVANESYVGFAHPKALKECLANAFPIVSEYERKLASSARLSDFGQEVERRAQIWSASMRASGGEPPTFVSRADLQRWLPGSLVTQGLDFATTGNDALNMQRLLDWPMRFVPVLENSALKRIVDKQAFAEQIARIFVREQVSRALSMTR